MVNLLKMKRVQMGLSQSRLSLQSGIEQHRISLMERNRTAPTPAEAEAIAKILGVKKGDLQKPAMPVQPG
jgi:transcriptional regulator with XRE-family HTH domain